MQIIDWFEKQNKTLSNKNNHVVIYQNQQYTFHVQPFLCSQKLTIRNGTPATQSIHKAAIQLKRLLFA